jgi:hypothetical protein
VCARRPAGHAVVGNMKSQKLCVIKQTALQNNKNKTKAKQQITKKKQQQQQHRTHCCVSIGKWSRKRATTLRYTFVAYLK